MTVDIAPCLKIAYWSVAIGWSVFLGSAALKIHDIRSDGRRVRWRDLPLARKVVQWWLNFLGGFVGFLGIWYVVGYRNVTSLEWSDLALLLIAFYSLTGHLPYILVTKPPWKA